MSRSVRLLLATSCVLAGLFTAGIAQAAPIIGVSQSFRDFGLKVPGSYNESKDITKSTSWPGLGINALRVIVPWDIALRQPSNPGYGRRQEFENWLSRLKNPAVKGSPYVVFGPTEEATNLADPSHLTRRSKPTGLVAPYPADYKTAIHKFLELWGPQGSSSIGPPVRLIAPWNEPNLAKLEMQLPGHLEGKHPIFMPGSTRSLADRGGCSHATLTNCGPYVVAKYWNEARMEMAAACPNGTSCYVVAGEFTGASGKKTKPYWEIYANKIEAVSGGLKPAIISFHSHRDFEPIDQNGDADCKSGKDGAGKSYKRYCTTVNFYKWLKSRGGGWENRKIWDTEVGALRHGSTDAAQKARVEFLIKLMGEYHVKRVYYFNYFPGGATTTDRGLLNGGSSVNTSPRPAYNVIKSVTCPTTCAKASADTFEAGAQIAESEPDPSEPELPTEEAEVMDEVSTDEAEVSEYTLPVVETEGVTDLGSSGVTLHGLVSPNEEVTDYHFKYGQTETYGSTTSIQYVAGSEEALETEAITGLVPSTTYHYRIVAHSANGVSEGEDKTFTTRPAIFFADSSNNNTLTYWSWNSTTGWQQNFLFGHPLVPGSSPSVVTYNGSPQIFFADATNNNTITAWTWDPNAGWQQTFLFGHAVAAGTSPAALLINGVPHVFFVDASRGNQITEWVWSTETGWQQNFISTDPVAAGSSPEAIVVNGEPRVFFSDASTNRSITILKKPGASWEQVRLYGDSAAAGSSPSAIYYGGSTHIYFADASKSNTLAAWVWSPTALQQSFFYGDAVTSGTSPSAIENGGAAQIYYSDAAKGNTLAAWTWAPSSLTPSYFYGHKIAAGSSPSATMEAGYARIYFSDATNNNSTTYWSWEPSLLQEVPLFGHAVMAGSSPQP